MRKSIDVDGFNHGKNPTPAAAVLRGIVMTGAIFGTDASTGRLAEGSGAQCEHMFANAQRILEAAGASFSDVLKMTFFIAPEVSRELINLHWVKAFPTAASRPARHVMVNERLPAGMLLQCDVFAVLPAEP